jgi:hypothetical protein
MAVERQTRVQDYAEIFGACRLQELFLYREERRTLGSFALICLLPYIMALIFSGFNSNLLSKHQLRILKRS